jgi:hypothetical protein
MHSFTANDLAGTTLATLAFALFLLPPGYLLGWASNLLGFRQRGAAERLLISLVLSVATVPVLAVLAARLLTLPAAIAIFVALALAALALAASEIYRNPPASLRLSRTTWIALALAAAWALFVMFSLADMQSGGRLYVSYTAFDHCVRQALVGAAARTGVPPLNPFYGLGHTQVMRYFYYWYVLCALPMRVTGCSARAALDASVVWCGMALAAIIPLYLKHILKETENLRGKSLVGIGLLLVTGLDILPSTLISLKQRAMFADTEWWDHNQVTSWFGSLLWTPHHVAGLIACFAGFLLLASLGDKATVRDRAWVSGIAGMAFACAAGLSVFVTLVFAIFAVSWTVLLLFRRQVRTSAMFAAAGGVALLLSLPYLGDLHGPSTASGHVVVFAFRDFPAVMDSLYDLGLKNDFLLNLAKFPVLAVTYFLEFGFFFLVAVARYRSELLPRKPLAPARLAAWVMMVMALVAITFLGSTATNTNDLGIRGALVVQFVLLLWAAPLAYDVYFGRTAVVTPRFKWMLTFTLVLGVMSTAEQCAMLRFYGPLADHGTLPRVESWMGSDPDFGTRTLWLRSGMAELARKIPANSVEQFDPIGAERTMLRLYSRHQMVAADDKCGAAFGGDEAACVEALPILATAFEAPETARRWNMDLFCDHFGIDVLVSTEVDPVWHDRGSWVWKGRAIVTNPGFRAISCGTRNAAAAK